MLLQPKINKYFTEIFKSGTIFQRYCYSIVTITSRFFKKILWKYSYDNLNDTFSTSLRCRSRCRKDIFAMSLQMPWKYLCDVVPDAVKISWRRWKGIVKIIITISSRYLFKNRDVIVTMLRGHCKGIVKIVVTQKIFIHYDIVATFKQYRDDICNLNY